MKGNYRIWVVYALLLATVGFIHLHHDITVPVNRPLQEIPAHLQNWRMVSQWHFDDSILQVLKPTDYLYRQYVDQKGNRVSFYLGYHGGGKDSGPVHSPKHCLPGEGWYEISENTLRIPVGAKGVSLVKAVYQRGEDKELFLYWFQVMGKCLTNEYSLKLADIINSVVHGRRDAAFIRISIPFDGDEAKALAAGRRFVRDFYPVIEGFLPQ